MKKIGIVVGTRPEAIKLIPVLFALKEYETLDVVLISTGQHKEMLDQIFEFFDIHPNVELDLMMHNQSLADLSALLLKELNQIFEDMNLDMLIVQGDTTSAMIGSLVGFYHRIKVGHVEAGLRTYDRFSPFPEEVNRRIIGITADLHFAPTERAMRFLKEEGVEKVYNVGNTVIDSLAMARTKVEQNIADYQSRFSFLSGKKKVLITGHRRESFGSPFQHICEAIKTLALAHPDIDFIYPVHLNPQVQQPVKGLLADVENIFLIDPVPYDQMVYLMMQAYLILTDSGGIQEEAPSLNVPVIVMREKTERPEGIEAGCALLAGTKGGDIIKAFEKLHSDEDVRLKMGNVENPYGDGQSAKRIAKIINQV